MKTSSSSTNTLLHMEGICKSFGTTHALRDVDFELLEGEVHALIGENGAGKSTLVKILSGAIRPSRGRMTLRGQSFFPTSPVESRKRGISMIYQELNLAPHLTVEENILLGKEKKAGFFLNKKEMRQTALDALKMVNHPEIPLDTPVSQLSVGIKQIIEIARALADKATILVMDEPTSSLSREDSERLFQVIHNLKQMSVSIVYISHFLEEVQKVADRFTVLRDGEKIKTGNIQEATHEKIIQLMIGRELNDMFPKIPHEIGDVALSLNELQGKRMPSSLNLQLHKGEILGFAGLVGAGRTEVLRTLFGLDPVIRGTIEIGYVTLPKSDPQSRIKAGMGYLSEDRQKEGLALSLSIADNIALSHFSPYSTFGLLNLKKYKNSIAGFLKSFTIKAEDSSLPVQNLSGGNQQKVALARLLHQKADILLLDEPTRGIDVLSKAHIYEWIGELASAGKAIIFVSSYLPELLGVCDKIAVFHRGRLVSILPADQLDAHSIMTAATLGRISEEKYSKTGTPNHA